MTAISNVHSIVASIRAGMAQRVRGAETGAADEKVPAAIEKAVASLLNKNKVER